MTSNLLTFNKAPSYSSLKNIISEATICQRLNNKQVLNRYGKLLLALKLYRSGRFTDVK
jgi:hypothetical protein